MHGIKTNVLTTGARAISASATAVIGLICTATAGTPASRCIDAPPASSAPKNTAVTTTQRGSRRASSATAIAV